MRYFLLFLSVLLFSCNKEENKTSKNVSIKKDTIQITKKKGELFSKKEPIQKLHSEAIIIMDEWQEYQSVSAFIPKFQKTSSKEILLNSNQFYELTTFLKDSIRLKRFDIPSVKIRLNVLHNEALRLFDMDSIPSITNKEVIEETAKIINAFNALNSKINSVIKRDLLTNSLTDESDYVVDFEKQNNKANPSNAPSKKRSSFNALKTNKKPVKKKRIKPLPSKKSMPSMKQL